MYSELQERFEGLSISARLLLYEPLHPEAVWKSHGREVCNNSKKGKAEYRNRREFLYEVYDRKCCLCGLGLSIDHLSLDHKDGRGLGGGRRNDNLSTTLPVHLMCNGRKGSRRIVDGEVCITCGHGFIVGGKTQRECFRCNSIWEKQ